MWNQWVASGCLETPVVTYVHIWNTIQAILPQRLSIEQPCVLM
jgi:hypothetical protein